MADQDVTVTPGGGDGGPVEPPYDAAAIAHIKTMLAAEATAQFNALQAAGKGESFQALLLQLVTTLLVGGHVADNYKPPVLQETQSFSLFGHQDTLTEKGHGEVSISLTAV